MYSMFLQAVRGTEEANVLQVQLGELPIDCDVREPGRRTRKVIVCVAHATNVGRQYCDACDIVGVAQARHQSS